MQVLERSAPILPLLPGTPARATHDYRRHGTTNLYSALDVASGCVISDLTERHRAEEFRRFLNLIERSVPAGRRARDRQQLLDAQDPAIHRWLLRHPRFTFHFTPTYSSWLNLVERPPMKSSLPSPPIASGSLTRGTSLVASYSVVGREGDVCCVPEYVNRRAGSARYTSRPRSAAAGPGRMS